MRFQTKLRVINFTQKLDDAIAAFAFGLMLRDSGVTAAATQTINILPPIFVPKKSDGRRTVKLVGDYADYEVEASTDVTARSDGEIDILVDRHILKRPRQEHVLRDRAGEPFSYRLPLHETIRGLAVAELEKARNGNQRLSAEIVLECLSVISREPEEIGTSYEELDQLLSIAV